MIAKFAAFMFHVNTELGLIWLGTVNAQNCLKIGLNNFFMKKTSYKKSANGRVGKTEIRFTNFLACHSLSPAASDHFNIILRVELVYKLKHSANILSTDDIND